MVATQGPLSHATSDGATAQDYRELAADIKGWARDLGFQQAGIADTDLSLQEPHFLAWLAAGHQGEMSYMERRGLTRTRPAHLLPGTLRVICVRMDYYPAPSAEPWSVLRDDGLGYVSRYALGRDYHRMLRRRLARLAERIRQCSSARESPGRESRAWLDR
jgi:epoxyqueuosine reductase